MYRLLLDHFGTQSWWPWETTLEIMIGAVLTQNTNWANVEKAIHNLKEHGLLSVEALNALSPDELAKEIRPAGYFNVKAKRLKNLIRFLFERYEGSLTELAGEETGNLREQLLAVNGIGPETADSILLYSLGRPVFVVDAYTHRILLRHGMADEQVDYHALQGMFMDNLPEDVRLFNEFHALIVRTGKEYCKKKPLCSDCPLVHWDQPPILPEY
ncbi:MAG: endonuclease III domain-containing protein [Deltaproteobacteria bacterium]|nr:endonuclease III domain-containing protein [Deltaproteobacteria bacterium]